MTRAELLINAKPINFQTDMVRAILDGRKTQTRRPIKSKLDGGVFDYYCRAGKLQEKTIESNGINSRSKEIVWHEPRYKVGDILYVRETWNYLPLPELLRGTNRTYFYKADGYELEDKWKSPANMPKEAARLFLRVTDVRAEQLQDIRENGAISEGFAATSRKDQYGTPVDSARCFFGSSWDKRYAKHKGGVHSWDKNPWVWVYEFERVEINE